VINGVYSDLIDSYEIIDSRYGYEYEGGHILQSTHMMNPNDFLESFFDCPRTNCAVIFHCEFSHDRGPKMAGQFRGYDRHLHMQCYPRLSYPHVFILDGGYRDFHEQYPTLCDGEYTPMLHEIHRRNGNLARCTSEYHQMTSAFDRLLSPPAGKGESARLMSPERRQRRNSPVSKFMLCLTNPNVIDTGRRLFENARPCAEFF
jgi:hypothetical protein